MTTLSQGQEFRGYILVKRLGSGGQSDVWLAEKDGQQVALKVPQKNDEVSWRRLQREAEILQKLEHCSYFPRVIELVERDKDPATLTMDFIHGTSLAEFLKKGPPHHERWEVLTKIADALQLLHGYAIVHRDIKPSNVMVQQIDSAIKVWIIDFGISVFSNNEDPLTQMEPGTDSTTFAPGTPAFMAPEVLLSKLSDADRSNSAIDVFSFGILGWVIMTGKHPATNNALEQGADYSEIYERKESIDPLERISHNNFNVEKILLSCIAINPQQRPSMNLVVSAFEPQQTLTGNNSIDHGEKNYTKHKNNPKAPSQNNYKIVPKLEAWHFIVMLAVVVFFAYHAGPVFSEQERGCRSKDCPDDELCVEQVCGPIENGMRCRIEPSLWWSETTLLRRTPAEAGYAWPLSRGTSVTVEGSYQKNYVEVDANGLFGHVHKSELFCNAAERFLAHRRGAMAKATHGGA